MEDTSREEDNWEQLKLLMDHLQQKDGEIQKCCDEKLGIVADMMQLQQGGNVSTVIIYSVTTDSVTTKKCNY